MERPKISSSPQGIATVSLIIILAIVIITAGVLWYSFSGSNDNTNTANSVAMNENVNSDLNGNTNTVTNENTNTNSQVNGNTNAATDPDEVGTSGWLTYTNEEYGYSFMYPLDSSVKENRISRELFSYFSAFFSLQTTNSYSTGIDVRTYESLSDLANGEDYETLDDWIAAHEGNLYEYRETSRLDGRKTFEGEEGGAYQHYSLYTEVDGKIFEIAFTWEYPDERIVDKDSQNILLNDEELGFLESFHLTDV